MRLVFKKIKKQFAMGVLLCVSLIAFTQASTTVPFQAVLRDSSGNILSERNISVRITLHDSSSTGNIIYQETQATTTNSSGQFALNIGSGNVLSGLTPFTGVGWQDRAIYTQIEVDSSGSSNYKTLVIRNHKIGPDPNANFKFW